MAQLKNTSINDTGFIQLSSGTTAQRPGSPVAGMIRYNTSLGHTEWYDGTYNLWFPTGFLPPVATGGTITNITQGGVNYRVHSFATVGSSTFTVTRGGPVEYLIVAGGGSGGSYVGGGGGAGGVLQGILNLSAGAYPLAIAAGGVSVGSTGASQNITGNPGGNSSAFGVTAFGGGGGSTYAENLGRPGGSGGGAGGFQNGVGRGGIGISGQGNAGGNTVGPRPRSFTGGAGGGGAGLPGRNSSNSYNAGGDGGDGVSSNILGTTYFWGGGGGGGNYIDGARPGDGGLGGGGGGSSNTANVSGIGGARAINNTAGGNGSPTGDPNNLGGNGAANSGGGGGGNGHHGLSGAGGSGFIAVRYRTS